MTTTTDAFAAGDRVGSYVIEAELTRGPLGVTYRAKHLVLPRHVRLRVMHANQVALRVVAVQMLREACFLEALEHGGIPHVYECGVLPDRRTWLATQLVDGLTLADRLASGPIAADTVTMLVRHLAEILGYAHRRGVVHRSLRPESIAYGVDRAFPVCIVDWSDARAHDAIGEVPHVPTPGSRAYVAPELIAGHGIDDRADVYALGAVAYHALTGAAPAIVAGTNTHQPVLQVAPGAPPVLAALIEQMLSPHPGDRPNSAEVMAAADLVLSGAAPAVPTQMRSVPRFAAPRWTPPMGSVTSDRATQVAGEIALAARK